MLNIFIGSQIRAASSCGCICSEHHAPNLLFPNIYRAKENPTHKVFWQCLWLLFQPKTAVTCRLGQLFPSAWVCQLAQRAPWEGSPAPAGPTRDLHGTDAAAALNGAEKQHSVSSGCLQGAPPSSRSHWTLFLAYYSPPAANINNRSSTGKKLAAKD